MMGDGGFTDCRHCMMCRKVSGTFHCLALHCPAISAWDTAPCRRERYIVRYESVEDGDEGYFRGKRGARAVEMVYPSGVSVRYRSLTKAWDSTGITPADIKSAIRKETRVGGFAWRWSDAPA